MPQCHRCLVSQLPCRYPTNKKSQSTNKKNQSTNTPLSPCQPAQAQTTRTQTQTESQKTQASTPTPTGTQEHKKTATSTARTSALLASSTEGGNEKGSIVDKNAPEIHLGHDMMDISFEPGNEILDASWLQFPCTTTAPADVADSMNTTLESWIPPISNDMTWSAPGLPNVTAADMAPSTHGPQYTCAIAQRCDALSIQVLEAITHWRLHATPLEKMSAVKRVLSQLDRLATCTRCAPMSTSMTMFVLLAEKLVEQFAQLVSFLECSTTADNWDATAANLGEYCLDTDEEFKVTCLALLQLNIERFVTILEHLGKRVEMQKWDNHLNTIQRLMEQVKDLRKHLPNVSSPGE
ncbi:uncharacterized protein F5Z01DRAFT_655153 [Emericellopsis atlantica]|uniref:Uncharacterized protein n=1 Tax=Emericellopsis atlantica TaxID=2614577 RepID=A0A9P7ZMB4_9HYPO|nr:uncharacterized protein F5Z01DRAFT_655153 [Emericellopsis atlantica]KAG9254332.1 hypothetical protein F5Z01DRAFT_655153 [Emericellopsis atlantica]